MSSHREAPAIAKDPVADSTDLYAFVSPDRPDHITLIANYIPLEAPNGGPNFYEFAEDVLYSIYIDNNRDGDWDIAYRFRFTTEVADEQTFLYNTGPIESLGDKTWNRRQVYSLTKETKVGDGRSTRSSNLGTGLACPPCNIGPLSTPDYASLAAMALHQLHDEGRNVGQVFAGQRAEGFYVDLGAIFDLGDLRPFEEAHNMFGLSGTGLGQMAAGVNATEALNVHSLALQVPIWELTSNHAKPTSVTDNNAVIGVWTTASRRAVRVLGANADENHETGPWVQVSRLGNPLVNEVLIPMGRKDYWNTEPPMADSQFLSRYQAPELASLLPTLYPNVFPHLQSFNASGKPRSDIVAILLTGLPTGVVGGLTTYTGPRPADMLRLNLAVAPAKSPNILGVLGGDLAGFPNGRRVFDDVVTIELRALAGLTLPLVDPSYQPDGAAKAVTDIVVSPTDTTINGTEHYLGSFPYLGLPHSGFNAGTPAAANGG